MNLHMIVFRIYQTNALISYFPRLQTFQLQMLSPSSTVIPPSGQVTQVLRVTNMNRVSYRLFIAMKKHFVEVSISNR